MAIWKVAELRITLEKMLDQRLFKEACLLIDSLDWKIRAEKYHTQQAEQAFFEHFGDSDIPVSKAVKLAIFHHGEDSAKFAYCQSVRQFNLIASVSASHTTPELFAQLIAILFFPNKFSVHQVTISKIIPCIQDQSLKSKFIEIIQSKEYEYIKAFSNMLKHICLVVPEYHIPFEEHKCHGILFKDFVYKGKTYSTKRDYDLIKEIKILRERYVILGEHISNSIIND